MVLYSSTTQEPAIRQSYSLQGGSANLWPASGVEVQHQKPYDEFLTTPLSKIRGAQLQGLTHFFQRRGGDEGDHLRVAFNLAENTAVIELSEESFEDDA